MACLTIVIILLFIVPTIYRYDKITKDNDIILIRTNRLTGNTTSCFSYKMFKNVGEIKKDWDTAKITTSFETLSYDQDKNVYMFLYIIQNNTNNDYYIPKDVDKLMAQRDNDILINNSFNPTLEKYDNKYLPAQSKMFISFDWPALSKLKDKKMTKEEAIKSLKELPIKGFVLFDDVNRYKIIFAKGW